ncbi:MAG: hypothetical protein QME78_17875 [Thermodesulfobacteriota bacterium]|nr:hypothetical protein [Thermodesulfobacteriota bacterium]
MRTVGYYDTPGYAYGVAVSGNYAYVADGGSGLRIINISDPATPTEAGFYDTPGYAMGVAVSGDYAYVADGDAGLRIYQGYGPAGVTNCEIPNSEFTIKSIRQQGRVPASQYRAGQG